MHKNPPTLATKLTNYKQLSQILPNTDNPGSYPCAKCALRVNFKNYKNMVKTVGSIISHSTSKKFNLRQHLTCKNYGIYVAKSKFCKMQYVKQTKNKFSTRWNNHRSFWNKFNVKDNNDRAALLKHFYKFHFNASRPDIIECCMVIFVEQLDKALLNWCENKWINYYLNAKININKIFLSYNCD